MSVAWRSIRFLADERFGVVTNPHERLVQQHLDRFTRLAQRAISLAREEAQRLGQDYVGAEHILLGLLQVPTGIAMTALSRMDIAPAAIRADIERIIAQSHPIRLGDVGVTPRARKVIELALDEATRLDQQPAGTEHLLLALIREADAIAAFVLIAHGATLERARAAIRAFDERAQARHSEQAGDR